MDIYIYIWYVCMYVWVIVSYRIANICKLGGWGES